MIDRTLTGLKFDTDVASPILNTGVTWLSFHSVGYVEVLMQRLRSFVRWTAIDDAENLRILGIISSGPQDLLHLISPRRVSIYETRPGWKEKFSLMSRDVMEETLGWVKNSSCLSFRADWSRIGVKKKELNKCDGSLTTLPSSIRWISSWETSLPTEGNRGFSCFQKLLGVVALEAESAQKSLIATRFSLVT